MFFIEYYRLRHQTAFVDVAGSDSFQRLSVLYDLGQRCCFRLPYGKSGPDMSKLKVYHKHVME